MTGTVQVEYAYIPLKTIDTNRWVWLREVYSTEQIVSITKEVGGMIFYNCCYFEYLNNAIRAKRIFNNICYNTQGDS